MYIPNITWWNWIHQFWIPSTTLWCNTWTAPQWTLSASDHDYVKPRDCGGSSRKTEQQKLGLYSGVVAVTRCFQNDSAIIESNWLRKCCAERTNAIISIWLNNTWQIFVVWYRLQKLSIEFSSNLTANLPTYLFGYEAIWLHCGLPLF